MTWNKLANKSKNFVYGLNEHESLDTNYMLFCFYCGKLYDKRYLRTHVLIHSKEEDYLKLLNLESLTSCFPM